MMSQGRKTGLLFIERRGVERLFGFVGGELVFGTSTAGTEADDAPAAVLGLLREQPGGAFTFLRAPAAKIPRAFPPRNTQHVVLDSLRKLDETGRLAGRSRRPESVRTARFLKGVRRALAAFGPGRGACPVP